MGLKRDRAFFEARTKVDDNGCWVWQLYAHRARGGTADPYGHTTREGDRSKPVGAHVVAHEAMIGPIPAGYHVDHTCLNTLCCNPNHLEAVTPAENNRRISERGRSRNQNTGKDSCPKCGGPYTLVTRPARPKGFRRCVPCHRAHQNEYERAQRVREE